MNAKDPSGPELFRSLLGAGPGCPPLERLELLLANTVNRPADLAHHVESCAHCSSELELLRSFQTGPRDEEEAGAVRLITARLTSPLPAAARQEVRQPWWKSLFEVRWMSPAVLAAACALVVVAVGLQWRHSTAPSLRTPLGSEAQAMRSGSLAINSPLGDIAEKPAAIEWQAVPGALQYQVRLLEVDGHELWSASTSIARVDLPQQVQNLILPTKTLVVEISALNGSGQVVAKSEPSRFRLLQKLYR